MEPVVYEESPLAEYLKDGGAESEPEWAPALDDSGLDSEISSSAPPSPSPPPFAPTGRPFVKGRSRNHLPKTPRVDVETSTSSPLQHFRKRCSAAVAASIDRADNARFLEQFRYTIVASQLLSDQAPLGQPRSSHKRGSNSISLKAEHDSISVEGIVASVLGALAVSVVLSWVSAHGSFHVTRKRLALLGLLSVAAVFLGQIYLRRQWLRYRREQALAEITSFVSSSHDFDSASGAALGLIQEVELVSRGYRLSTPLPPISRLEDRLSSRKCLRIRSILQKVLSELLVSYRLALDVVRGFSEQTELDKYFDIYDINDLDIADALAEIDEAEDEQESLRVLKISSARLHVMRKLILCALLALEADGHGRDLSRWTSAVGALQTLNKKTAASYARLESLLSQQDSFPTSESVKMPLTPNRERWRSQLRKLNSLSTGIRGLQAKLQLLREESDRSLDDSVDLSEMGPSLMLQYESIGVDLKELMTVWEEGKAALAQGIDRNEKRLSSMSTLISPSSSVSGQTMVGEGGGGTEDALKALTGASRPASEGSVEETQEVFEAIAVPRLRPRSSLSREERIAKMREEREQKTQARQQVDATRGMLKELETVINLRPKSLRPREPHARVLSS